MVLAQPSTFALDKIEVAGTMPGHLLPIETEMPFDAVPFLKFNVGQLGLLEQRSNVPGINTCNN